MRAAILAFLLFTTGCALIPVRPNGWLANRAKDRKYCESARANGWDGPMARRLRCGVDPLPVAPTVAATASKPCTAAGLFYRSPTYSENRVIRRLQVMRLWPMGHMLVVAPLDVPRTIVNDPSACPG